MNKSFHQKVIADTVAQLKAKDIDCYVILTSEGSDRMASSYLPGVGTVGSGAFLFTKAGKSYALSSSIDAQDIEESGLLDEVMRYTAGAAAYDQMLTDLIERIAPKRVAFNDSQTVPFLDGLTMGRYRRFKEAMRADFEEVSADTFMPEVLKANPLPSHD